MPSGAAHAPYPELVTAASVPKIALEYYLAGGILPFLG
jgi:hypothetical protein